MTQAGSSFFLAFGKAVGNRWCGKNCVSARVSMPRGTKFCDVALDRNDVGAIQEVVQPVVKKKTYRIDIPYPLRH